MLWPRLVPGDLVKALLTNAGALAGRLPRLTEQERFLLLRGQDDPWTDADVPLLDEAASLVDGPPERTYGLVVDEAQELTAMQWRMIVRRCPSRAMTLVGDFAQAGPVATARDWREALSPHVGPAVQTAQPDRQLSHHGGDPGERPGPSCRRPKHAAWNSTG
ncbi:hypothetical protein ASC99_28965 [Kitasatospora sp. Root107]|nr:hypothetical protein ASC99_28965 [Kitasatospora sp. Root107]